MDQIILHSLLKNDEYTKKVLPYLKSDYFSTHNEKIIFKILRSYFLKYQNLPTSSIIKVALTNSTTIREETFTQCCEYVDELDSINEDFNIDWLVDNTEVWAKNSAMENAILESVEILKNENENKGMIQELVSSALEVNFDSTIGVDLLDEADIDRRWESYHSDTVRFPTRLNKLNEVLNGGFKRKCLHVLLCPTHGGKTSAKISIAADFIRNGHDVLYVTLEMSEDEISKRFESNFLRTPINDIDDLAETKFKSSLLKLKRKGYGQLKIKEFPPACTNASHIRTLLNDLKVKKKFVPTLVVFDYLNLMTSVRYSEGNSYTIIKSIAEEMRGVGVEGDYVMLSSTQTNRGGHSSSDLQVEDVSESYGLPQTVDLLIAIITNEELREQGIQIWKSLKNRLSGIIDFKFPVKAEFDYCSLSDVDRDMERDMPLINNEKAASLVKKVKDKKKLKELKISVSEDEIKDDLDDLMGD